jgi:hypothetical protein
LVLYNPQSWMGYSKRFLKRKKEQFMSIYSMPDAFHHFILFCFPLLRVELRASHLLGRCSTTWATPLTLSVLLFLRQVLILCSGPTWTTILFVLPCVAGKTGTHHWIHLLFEMGSHKLLPRLASNHESSNPCLPRS